MNCKTCFYFGDALKFVEPVVDASASLVETTTYHICTKIPFAFMKRSCLYSEQGAVIVDKRGMLGKLVVEADFYCKFWTSTPDVPLDVPTLITEIEPSVPATPILQTPKNKAEDEPKQVASVSKEKSLIVDSRNLGFHRPQQRVKRTHRSEK